MKHTEGPWRATPYGQTFAIDSPATGTLGIAHINPNGDSDSGIGSDQDRANARLIAAAPALLEACKKLCNEIHLGKLNIRKDFSLINAHAAATKAILQAERGGE